MIQVDFLDIKKFLTPGSKNYIAIMFNQKFFENTTQGQLSFTSLEGKWLFISHEHKNFIYTTQFILDGQSFPIQEFHEVIHQAKNKWQKLCPTVSFPDIVISDFDPKTQSAFLSLDKEKQGRHMIFLNLQDLNSLEIFKFTLGHELGHLYYFLYIQKSTEQKLDSLKFKKFVPWEILTLALISIGLNSYLLISPAPMIIQLLAGVQIILWSWYLLLNYLSFPRLKNYSAEFFSDYFAHCFGGPFSPQFKIFYSNFHHYSHPAGTWRHSILKKLTAKNTLNNWHNPVETYYRFFRFLNPYEFLHTQSLVFNKLKSKLIKKKY